MQVNGLKFSEPHKLFWSTHVRGKWGSIFHHNQKWTEYTPCLLSPINSRIARKINFLVWRGITFSQAVSLILDYLEWKIQPLELIISRKILSSFLLNKYLNPLPLKKLIECVKGIFATFTQRTLNRWTTVQPKIFCYLDVSEFVRWGVNDLFQTIQSEKTSKCKAIVGDLLWSLIFLEEQISSSFSFTAFSRIFYPILTSENTYTHCLQTSCKKALFNWALIFHMPSLVAAETFSGNILRLFLAGQTTQHQT